MLCPCFEPRPNEATNPRGETSQHPHDVADPTYRHVISFHQETLVLYFCTDSFNSHQNVVVEMSQTLQTHPLTGGRAVTFLPIFTASTKFLLFKKTSVV